MNDETNVETINRELAELAACLAQFKREVTSCFADMDRTIAQIKCDVSEVRQEVSRVSGVLDEHDRMLADIYQKLGAVPPTANDITGSRGVRGRAVVQNANPDKRLVFQYTTSSTRLQRKLDVM